MSADDPLSIHRETGKAIDADARRTISQHIENCAAASSAIEWRLQSIDQKIESAVVQREAAQRELRKYLIGLVSLAIGMAGWVLSHGPLYTPNDRFEQLAAKFEERTQRRDAQIAVFMERLQAAELKIDQLQHQRGGN